MYLTLQGRGCRHFVHCSTEKPQACSVAGITSNGGNAGAYRPQQVENIVIGLVIGKFSIIDKRHGVTGSNVLLSSLIVCCLPLGISLS